MAIKTKQPAAMNPTSEPPRPEKNVGLAPMKLWEMKVSPRDRAIYSACKIEHKTQREVAAEQNLSQARISAIVKRVERWLGVMIPNGFEELGREPRLRAAMRTHQMRLENAYKQAMRAWEISLAPRETTREQIIKDQRVALKSSTGQNGHGVHLMNSVKIAERIVQFEGFELNGHVDVGIAGRLYEVPTRTSVEINREIKRRVLAGVNDTEGDEGVPGMWAEEFNATQARLATKKAQQEGRRVSEEGAGTNTAPPPRSGSPLPVAAAAGSGAGGEGSEVQHNSGVTPVINRETPLSTAEDTMINPEKLLSDKSPNESQPTAQQVVANHGTAEKLLSKYTPVVENVPWPTSNNPSANTPSARAVPAPHPDPLPAAGRGSEAFGNLPSLSNTRYSSYESPYPPGEEPEWYAEYMAAKRRMKYERKRQPWEPADEVSPPTKYFFRE